MFRSHVYLISRLSVVWRETRCHANPWTNYLWRRNSRCQANPYMTIYLYRYDAGSPDVTPTLVGQFFMTYILTHYTCYWCKHLFLRYNYVFVFAMTRRPLFYHLGGLKLCFSRIFLWLLYFLSQLHVFIYECSILFHSI